MLKLEHCELEYFTPKKSIPGLKDLSLEGNKIPDLNSIIFKKEKEEVKDKKDKKSSRSSKNQIKNQKILIYEVKLKKLNLADNCFTKFPY